MNQKDTIMPNPILINKKIGWTSQNAISHYKSHHKVYIGSQSSSEPNLEKGDHEIKVQTVQSTDKNETQINKIGYIGTLDPLATGLLVAFANQETKLISQYSNLNKTYLGTFCIGLTTPSLDCEFLPEKLLWDDETGAESDLKHQNKSVRADVNNSLDDSLEDSYLKTDEVAYKNLDDGTANSITNNVTNSIVDIKIGKDQKKYPEILKMIQKIVQSVNAKDDQLESVSGELKTWKEFLENSLKGQFWQFPPIFSAVKKNGKKGYQIARENIKIAKKLETEAQNGDSKKDVTDGLKDQMDQFEKSKQKLVDIYSFEIEEMAFWSKSEICKHYLQLDQKLRSDNQKWKNYNWQESECIQKLESQIQKKSGPKNLEPKYSKPQYLIIKARLEVSSGTYIRSIARDLGILFGSQGFLLGLVRTKVGEFVLEGVSGEGSK